MALIPVHEIRNYDKFEALKASMRENGWMGADLVADGDQLLTGTHRLAAWLAIGNDEADIPVIDIRDIYAPYGQTWDDILADADGDTEFALTRYPESVQRRYGFDTDTVIGDDAWMEA